MLKKIPTNQVRVGMHLHKLEGAWLNHPFWKSRFVLTDPEDLRRLHGSGVPSVWIDDALGLDVADADPAPAALSASAAPPLPPAAAAAEPVVRPVPHATSSLHDELDRALRRSASVRVPR